MNERLYCMMRPMKVDETRLKKAISASTAGALGERWIRRGPCVFIRMDTTGLLRLMAMS